MIWENYWTRWFYRDNNEKNGKDHPNLLKTKDELTTYKVFRDICYYKMDCGTQHEKHFLNIYKPNEPHQEDYPVLIFVHGGGWRRGDRNYLFNIYGRVGESFSSKGCVTVVISYRLAPEYKHPDQVNDIGRAIKWVEENIAQWRKSK